MLHIPVRNKMQPAIARSVLIFVILFCAGNTFAQKYDWGLWTSIDIEKKLNRQWTIDLGGQYRWKEGTSLTDQMRGSFDAGYKPWKFLKFGAGYELIADKKKKKDIFVYRHRLKIEATGSYKLGRFAGSWRPRLQATWYDKTEMDAGELDNYRWVVRNRFGLSYNVPKIPLKPYVQFELFNRVFSDATPGYYKNRISAGLEYTIARHHEIDLGYKRDNETLEKVKFHFDVVAVGYKFSF